MSEESALTFPCQFPIKVMGVNSDTFENEVFMIANQYIPNLGETAIRSKPSGSAKYLSVTVTFTAQNREQVDNLYRAFNKHPDVKMVL
jgi:putative lipoic acid-binding regulatory protein